MDVSKEFGNIIREKRKKQNLTQEELAEKCNLSTRHINSIEHGYTNPKFDTVMHICSVCGIDVGELPVSGDKKTY